MQENKQKWEKEFNEFIARTTESIKIFNGGGHDYCNVCGISPSKLKQFITNNFISKEEALQAIREAYYDGLNDGQSEEDYIDDNFSAEEYLTRPKR